MRFTKHLSGYSLVLFLFGSWSIFSCLHMEEDGEAHAVCECVCVPLRCSAWALIVCLLGAECWAEWGRDWVLIDFGHTSLLLKIPWLLLFCSLSPSFCLASSNETPNELEHVLTALPLFVSLLLSHRPPSSLSHSGSPCWFLYCSPSTPLSFPRCVYVARPTS